MIASAVLQLKCFIPIVFKTPFNTLNLLIELRAPLKKPASETTYFELLVLAFGVFEFQRSKVENTCYRRSHSKMCTKGVLKTIGIKHFNYRTAQAIIVWLKVSSIWRQIQRSSVLSLSRVWIQISQKSISAKVGVVCSWLAWRCASTKVVVWLLGI